MSRRGVLAVLVAAVVAVPVVAVAAGSGYTPPCTNMDSRTCQDQRTAALESQVGVLTNAVASLNSRLDSTPQPTPTPTAPTSTPTPSPTVTPSATPSSTVSPTPSVTPSPSTTPTPTPTSSFACTVPLGGSCGPYLSKATWQGSNGYNTYVSNQALGGSGTEVISANGPGDWKLTATMAYNGGSVLSFPDTQQLMNNWGTAGWNGSADTPLDSLTSLKINYNETSPGGSNSYEFAPDIFQDGYANDVMFWVDTNGRCNTGAFGSTVLGHLTINGQGWTAHRYGGYGAEIILVLDGPGGQGTCAQQSSGTIDVKAGFAWLSAGGFIPAHPVLSIIQTGWELTGASNATFRMNSYSIAATL